MPWTPSVVVLVYAVGLYLRSSFLAVPVQGALMETQHFRYKQKKDKMGFCSPNLFSFTSDMQFLCSAPGLLGRKVSGEFLHWKVGGRSHPAELGQALLPEYSSQDGHSASHKITSDLIKQTNCLKVKMLSFSPLSGNFPSFKVNRVKSWLRKSWHNHSHLKSQIFVKVGSGLRVLVICLLKAQCLSPNYVQVNACLEIIQSFKIEGFAPWLPTH